MLEGVYLSGLSSAVGLPVQVLSRLPEGIFSLSSLLQSTVQKVSDARSSPAARTDRYMCMKR